ncbi:TPA: hypothetical protein NR553_002509, partial [Staphylococcus aureus]|nr:hypothetical protein [Staphylococcus aureus]
IFAKTYKNEEIIDFPKLQLKEVNRLNTLKDSNPKFEPLKLKDEEDARCSHQR